VSQRVPATRRRGWKAGRRRRLSATTRANTFQNTASCAVAKLMRISVLGLRLAWNSAPGASR
jgi:hypothetical protein